MQSNQEKCYEDYPIWMVVMSNLVSLLIYFIGGILVYQVGLLWLALYIIFALGLEIKTLSSHCVDCYYFGKTCCFGKGRLSSLFFKRGNPVRFTQNKITWKAVVPDFLISLGPIVIGIIVLIIRFNWLILFLVILLFGLGFMGTGLVRGQLACMYCKQREIGCPAQKLFEKNKK